MSDEILTECRQAKDRLAALFRDVDTLIDFMMKRREQRMKQGRNTKISHLIAKKQKKTNFSASLDTQSQMQELVLNCY